MNNFLYWLATLGSSIVAIVGLRTAEEPKYQIMLKKDNIEIRRYEPMVTASISMSYFANDNRGDAFRALASYIFGENKSEEKLPMTAPVISTTAKKIPMTSPVITTQETSINPEMSFIMPSSFDLKTLPKPIDSRIKLNEVPSKTYAVIRFSGSYSDESFKTQTQKLRDWLLKEKIEILSEPQWAGYDPPFTIPALKRNEVMIEVRFI
jgi:effector-binding domain-containing protein